MEMKYYMTKEQIISVVKYVNNSRIFTFISISILFFGIGLAYQAHNDEVVLNNLLSDMSNHTTEKYITDGENIYSVYKSNTELNFSSNEFMNKTQCQTLYGIGTP